MVKAAPSPVSSRQFAVAIPTFERPERLCSTLDRLEPFSGKISGVYILVDGGDRVTDEALCQRKFTGVRWQVSKGSVGPGGARNCLFREVDAEWILSLDDDSWPMDPDFFERLLRLVDEHPRAAVLAASVILPDCESEAAGGPSVPRAAACFENCGCVIRRAAFLQTSGFLPLRYAYGMEEADVALQLMDRGWEIAFAPDLRVYHDTTLAHHASPEINAAHISNTALLGFLRYPVVAWPWVLLQVLNRVRYALRSHRHAGVLRGLMQIPSECWRQRRRRSPVRFATLLRSMALRRQEARAESIS